MLEIQCELGAAGEALGELKRGVEVPREVLVGRAVAVDADPGVGVPVPDAAGGGGLFVNFEGEGGVMRLVLQSGIGKREVSFGDVGICMYFVNLGGGLLLTSSTG